MDITLGGGLAGCRVAKSQVDCIGLAEEASEGKNVSKWPKDHSWDILAKKVTAFALKVCLRLN